MGGTFDVPVSVSPFMQSTVINTLFIPGASDLSTNETIIADRKTCVLYLSGYNQIPSLPSLTFILYGHHIVEVLNDLKKFKCIDLLIIRWMSSICKMYLSLSMPFSC